jgi:hypothetical protein
MQNRKLVMPSNKKTTKSLECLSENECVELLGNLKHFGYLLPTNEEELKEFESVHGTTNTLMPENLQNPDFLFEKKEKLHVVRDVPNKTTPKSRLSKKTTAKVAPFVKNAYFKKLVLAAEITNQLHNEPTFGHIKFVKVLYLCENVCNLQLGSKYGRYAAGPLDPKSMYSIDSEFKKRKWFQVIKTNYGYRYSPDLQLDEYKGYYLKYYGETIDGINTVIAHLRRQDSNYCEIVATMYAVWKDRVTKNLETSANSLVIDFYNWSKEKSRFDRVKLYNAIEWMKSYGFYPMTS